VAYVARAGRTAAGEFVVAGLDREQHAEGRLVTGDGPENYSYSAVAAPVEPEDGGEVPPLVMRARQMGLDV
jgi:hypothetical protein